MGMVALNRSSNDFCFGNRDVMRIISKNRFEEIIQYLHFSVLRIPLNPHVEGFDRLYKILQGPLCFRSHSAEMLDLF